MNMVNVILLVVSIGLAIVGQILMKQGMIMFGQFPMSQFIQNIFPMLFQPFVFFGIVAFGFSSLFWLAVISRIQLSLAYPLVSVAYVITAIYSYYFFNENLSPLRWIGIIIICIGVFIISRS
jgi:multidrug transporter EmrE-like cation transporter